MMALNADSHPPEDVELGSLKCEADTREMVALMTLRGEEAHKKICHKYGSVHDLCTKLGVSPLHGLSSDEAVLAERRAHFGANQIPMKKPRNFFLLVLDALRVS
jgi:hypothetical protein